jgi:hypothetical protein
MSALVAVSQMEDLNVEIEMTETAYQAMLAEGASMSGFLPGERASVRDFLCGCLLPSGGDCCICLAEYVSGSEDKFVAIMNRKAEKLGMTEILCNHGYVSRGEALRLQQISDIFLVLSWNRHDSQGVMPGKFYEGIRAKRTILSLISGDLAGSELHTINEMYNYGFCYEASRDKMHFDQLCNFLVRCYEEKMNLGTVQHEVNPALEDRFRYDNIAKQLEEFIQTI